MFSMTEDDDLAHWLRSRYADNRNVNNWNDNDYIAWVERQHAENHVVFLVWLDNTKPQGVDHIILKDERPMMVGQYRREVIHCESAKKAELLKTMLLARFDE
jgi:hypothetical protein